MRVHGFVAPLADQGPTRGPQHVFVNRRIVRDKTIAHAILDAYSVGHDQGAQPRGAPVHRDAARPRRRERAPDQGRGAVPRAVARPRGRAPGVGRRARRGPRCRSCRCSRRSASAAARRRSPAPASRPAGVLAGWLARVARAPGCDGRATRRGTAHSSAGGAGVARRRRDITGIGARCGRLTPLGQFRDTFILAVDDEGIVIIDQHVAHERVLFERIMRAAHRRRAREPAAARAAGPRAAPARARRRSLARAADLARFGFDVEEFGGASVRVTAVPALLGAAEDATRALRALAEDLEGLDRGLRASSEALQAHRRDDGLPRRGEGQRPADAREDASTSSTSCARTAYSTVCPHGRPVMLRITRREIEKSFERI